MNKKQMSTMIDQALAERIQLLVIDPGFPAEGELRELVPKELVSKIWMHNGWEPDAQPWGLLRLWAANAISGLAQDIMEQDETPACYMVLREFSTGFWDRGQALNISENELFFRFHTYAALFELGKPMLQAIAEEALEMVECAEFVEIDYRFWQMTQGLAA